MFCKVCVESKRNPKSSFVLGSDSFRHDSVRKHQETEQHAKLAKEKNSRLLPIEKTASGQMLSDMRVADTDRVAQLFRICHAMALKGRPYTDYTWMAKLDQKQGLNIGGDYLNDKQARTFTNYIAEVERSKLVIKRYILIIF